LHTKGAQVDNIEELHCYNYTKFESYLERLVKLHANSIYHNSKTKQEKNLRLMQHVWINLQKTPYSLDEVVTSKISMKKEI